MRALGIILITLLLGTGAAAADRASWYGPGFDGRRTASGEVFRQEAATCAHRRLPFGTMLRVTNLANGRSAHCRVNDRGPFTGGRALDVSKGVARQLQMLKSGTARVSIEVIN